MPTKKQLFKIWETQYEFFGGSGQPKQNYVGNTESHGMTSEMHIDTPIIPKQQFTSFSGREIGLFRFNPVTKDLQIVKNIE